MKKRQDKYLSPKPSFMKQTLFAVTGIFLFFVFCEIAFYLMSPLYGNEKVSLTNRFDPEKKSIAINREINSQLPETVLHNITDNPLTFPDEELIFRVRPNANGMEMFGYSGINSMGFRGKEFDLSSEKKRKRVLILGDSCSFGWGLKDYKKTFGYLLEKKLFQDSDDYELYNLSQPGFSTSQGIYLYRQWLDKIDPDIIILYYGWNDVFFTPLLTDKQTLALLRYSANPVMRFIKKSNIYSFYKFLIEKVIKGNGGPVKNEFKRVIDSGVRVPIDEALANYDEIIDKAKRKDAEVIVILPPFSSKLPLEKIVMYNRSVRQHLNDKVTFLKIEDLRNTNPYSFALFLNDGFHPNEAGARYIAKELAELIVKKQPNP